MSEPEKPPRQKRDKDHKNPSRPTRPTAPNKAETALLPAFPGLPLEKILVPKTEADCQSALAEIWAAGITGFDTEAKPTFRKGEVSSGPHVVQFSLSDKAYIFQLRNEACQKAAATIIASEEILKVGFGLKNDHKQIRKRLGIDLTQVLDLDQIFRKMGYAGQIGVRGAIGVLLKLCFKKSKSTTTSNWALAELSERQLSYAANDAYAALKILEKLQEKGLVGEDGELL